MTGPWGSSAWEPSPFGVGPGTGSGLVGPPPDVPAWMLASGDGFRAAQTNARHVAEALVQAATPVTADLGHAATALGWRSSAARATGDRAGRSTDLMHQVAEAFATAAAALGSAAVALDDHGGMIRTLLHRRAGLASLRPTGVGIPGLSASIDVDEVRLQVDGLDRQIAEQKALLEIADQRAGQALNEVGARVRALCGGLEGLPWVTSLAEPQVLGVLAHHGVIGDGRWSGSGAPVAWGALAANPLLAQVQNGKDPFLLDDPGLLLDRALRAVPDDAGSLERASAVSAWFRALTPIQQIYLTQKRPELIGNLDGIPFGARDIANRVRLEQLHATLGAQQRALVQDVIAGRVQANSPYARDLGEQLAALRATEKVMKRQDRHLILLDLDATGTTQPKVAIAVGDLDTARNVAVFTPGLSSTVAKSMPGHDYSMRAMQQLAQEVGDKWAHPSEDTSAATVTWYGYDAPQWDGVADPGRSVAGTAAAQTGGVALNSFYAGISATRAEDPHLTALGHSYGSLTTATGLHDGQVGVDDAVFFGSPGLGVPSAASLHVDKGHAYLLEAKGDPVADLGAFGGDPSFNPGLTDLATRSSVSPFDGKELAESTGHSRYLSEDTTSQYNIATVVAGVPEHALRGHQWGAGDVAGALYRTRHGMQL